MQVLQSDRVDLKFWKGTIMQKNRAILYNHSFRLFILALAAAPHMGPWFRGCAARGSAQSSSTSMPRKHGTLENTTRLSEEKILYTVYTEREGNPISTRLRRDSEANACDARLRRDSTYGTRLRRDGEACACGTRLRREICARGRRSLMDSAEPE